MGAFCVALSLVFAFSSATSIVDRLEHAGHVPHSHHHFAFSDIVVDHDHAADHHHDHADDDDDDHGALTGGVASIADHGGGAVHHHHADGPTGMVAMDAPAETLLEFASSRSVPVSDAMLRSPLPSGLERPPKA